MSKLIIKNRRYLGSKAKLIEFIKQTVENECNDINIVADIFAGTGNIAYAFNKQETSIIVNDILEVNNLAFLSWFGKEEIENEKIKNIIKSYNEQNITEDNYFSINFANTFFSLENCRKIGFIRDDIELKYNKKEINERERAILITSLIYSADKIANTVGHYDAYRLKGDLSKKIVLSELELPEKSINENNYIYKKDANKLVKEVYADLVYIDPPYNSRQYCDAYHLLENIATWQKPEVFGTAKKMNRKIDIKSKYCTNSATFQFADLIENINAKYIMVSYNNMGLKGAGRSQAKISDVDIMKILSKKGLVKVFEIDFNQFTTGKTKIEEHKERLFLCEVGKGTEYVFEEKINGFAKSPLNYTGGKYKLLYQLIDKFPKHIDTFVDVFGGGFNVGANIEAVKTVYNDKQKEVERVIKLFKKYGEESIIKKIESISNEYNLSNTMKNGYDFYNCQSDSGVGSYNKDNYTQLRNKYNSMKNSSENKDFILLTLIIFAFNNQIRFNSSGDFNMPVGKRDFNSSTRRNIKDFAIMLKTKDIDFFNKDFAAIPVENYKNPFLYCDPPYLLGTASYNENNGWTEIDELKLLDYLKEKSDKGIKFALSNVIEHKGLKHQKLLDWAINNRYNINYINSSYNNSNYQIKDKDNATIEVLITNY